LPAFLQPSPVTATDHQRLLDCPYQYFCASGLGLRPEKDVREEIEKMDFGTHVHRILQAFHAGAPKLPGPWQKPLNDDTLPEAEALLRNISQEVFAGDLRRRFFTRGWLYRWEACIPAYLAWEMKHSSRWRIQATEWKKQRDYQEDNTHITITGRIDRLDRDADGYCIIDYKTGAVSSRDLLLQGEEIQLPFYALLLDEENIAQALYLSIQDGKVTEKSALDITTLAMLRTAVRKRLILLKQLLDEETPLPAWGDTETCRLCDMEGLCRREMWVEPIRSTSQM
jgi:ATP-dependent helicase/nuclease subunit B